MALKKMLMATAAVPVIALFGLSPALSAVRPPAVAVQASHADVILAASDEEELLLQKKRHKGDQNDNSDGKKNNAQQHKKRDNAQEQQKKRRDAAGDDQNQQRRKPKETQEQQRLDQKGSDGGNNADKRRKKQQRQDGADEGFQRPMQHGAAEDFNMNSPQPQKKRAKDQDQQKVRQQDADQQSGDEQVSPKKNKARDNANQDSGDRSGQKKQIRDNANQDNGDQDQQRKRRQQANDQDNADRAAQQDDNNRRDKPRRLNVDKGAAVLDSEKRGDGSDRRRKRDKQYSEDQPVRIPRSDREAQDFRRDRNLDIRPALSERGRVINDFRGYDVGDGRRLQGRGDRIIVNVDGRIIVRDDDRRRLHRNAQARYEELDNGRIREVVRRPDGSRVVTVRNRYGEIIRRSRIYDNNREVILFYSPVLERGETRLYRRDPGDDLPPMRLTIPVDDYIIDVSQEPDRNYERFLAEPPVEPVERIYSVDEVKYSARIRDKVRRIDLDTITFATGSAEISMNQASSLKRVGQAIRDLIDKDPGESFLIEGHTDAVGSDEDNLILSDQRAEAVASLLTDMYDIPPENLVTQGYGERYLKVDTDGPEEMNRRVTIRRITPLVRPIASNQ